MTTSDVANGPSKYSELNDEEWLRDKYVSERLSIYEIADLVGCGQSTVNRHLARHGIERTPDTKNVDSRLLDADWLEEQYVEKNRNIRDIADEVEYAPKQVSKWLKHHDIDVKTGGETTWYPELADAKLLEELYINQGRSLAEIASHIGCSEKGVHSALARHEIISPSHPRPSAEGKDARVPLHTNVDGYEAWSESYGSRTSTTVFVHQLLAVAVGADASCVFGGGYDCHHKNEIPWDNRPENIEVLAHGDHTRLHNDNRSMEVER